MKFPRSIVPVLRFAASEGGRFCIHGAHVVVRGGVTRVEVTDGRMLGVVEYPSPDDPDEDVILDARALTFLLGGDVPMVVGENEYGEEFKYDPIPALRSSMATIQRNGDGSAVALFHGPKSANVVLNGKFPQVGDVIPSGEPAASILVNTTMLRAALDVVDAIADPEYPVAWLSIAQGVKGPLIVQAARPDRNQETFTALVMGVAPYTPRPPMPACERAFVPPTHAERGESSATGAKEGS